MQSHSSNAAPLRALTHRLSSIPTKQLPQTLPRLIPILISCKPILSAPASHSQGRDASEAAVLTHKFKTQLTTLLSGKSPEGRWTAVVLIKGTVDIGGWEILRACEPWVRGLLGVLSKPDPPTTKQICIVTLTKIFLLTHEYPTLIREITTPSLQPFVTSSLNLIAKVATTGDNSALIDTILNAFCRLLPRHPNSFRSFAAQIQTSLLPLIAPTPSSHTADGGRSVAQSTSEVARRVFVSLHHCAPKNTSGPEWGNALRAVLTNVHCTADQVFRSVIEDWEPAGEPLSRGANPKTLSEVVSDFGSDPMNLPKWVGIDAGVERLAGLLGTVKAFLLTPTSSAINLPIGLIMDTLARIFAIAAPSSTGSDHSTIRFNPQIERIERDGLLAGLPHVHVSCMEILMAMTDRLEKAFGPMVQGCVEQLCWIYQAERWSSDIRTSTYTLLAKLLQTGGPAFKKSTVSSLSKIILACCDDLLPPAEPTTPAQDTSGSKKGKGNAAKNMTIVNADKFLTPATHQQQEYASKTSIGLAGLTAAASHLLPILLTHLPTHLVPFPVRTKIDRTAILLRHEEAMYASVLNPPPTRKGAKTASSILPLLARAYPTNMDVEALIRPRMPVIRTLQGEPGESDETGDGAGAEADGDEEMESGSAGGKSTDAIQKINAQATNAYLAAANNAQQDESTKSNYRREPTPTPSETRAEAVAAAAITSERSSATTETPAAKSPAASTSLNNVPGLYPDAAEGKSTKRPFAPEVSPERPEASVATPISSRITGGSGDTNKKPRIEVAPAPVLVRDASSEHVATVPAGEVPGAKQAATTGDDVDDDDDDDFEIPELVMDADTDEDE
ncbi:hypothetical protein L228DRAFT_263892 [Xylona heveae TC161]|uniref:Pre-rRNA-processing protein RIX1 n=1 Tax=Xylona heveae (strain CBS 132557 / TC161) TaxID=1328760 RepID=A0A164ZI28_XYLHT|nr:hypothetical protein L228DRAFT_263892 [Xylona heveae TC161]KZF19124.1 hypothetical protein L228DRAFT_263892 [Xylona heveae TC161]